MWKSNTLTTIAKTYKASDPVRKDIRDLIRYNIFNVQNLSYDIYNLYKLSFQSNLNTYFYKRRDLVNLSHGIEVTGIEDTSITYSPVFTEDLTGNKEYFIRDGDLLPDSISDLIIFTPDNADPFLIKFRVYISNLRSINDISHFINHTDLIKTYLVNSSGETEVSIEFLNNYKFNETSITPIPLYNSDLKRNAEHIILEYSSPIDISGDTTLIFGHTVNIQKRKIKRFSIGSIAEALGEIDIDIEDIDLSFIDIYKDFTVNHLDFFNLYNLSDFLGEVYLKGYLVTDNHVFLI